MRREGRVHGSCVRMRKDDILEYNKRAPRKPTNHSRMTGACLSNRRHCLGCHDSPVLKAMCKTKGKHKLTDQDITKNHKLYEFALGCSPSSFGPSSWGFSKYYEVSGDDLRYSYDSEYTNYDEEETLDQSEDHRSSEMMFTIANFLYEMGGAQETSDIISEEDIPYETSIHKIPGEPGTLSGVEAASDCSWSGIDVSDSEQSGVDMDGWYLVV